MQLDLSTGFFGFLGTQVPGSSSAGRSGGGAEDRVTRCSVLGEQPGFVGSGTRPRRRFRRCVVPVPPEEPAARHSPAGDVRLQVVGPCPGRARRRGGAPTAPAGPASPASSPAAGVLPASLRRARRRGGQRPPGAP